MCEFLSMESNSAAHHGNYVQSVDDQDAQLRRHDQMERKKTCAEVMRDLKTFIWNPEKGEVLGRDKRSWGLILLFYFVFYAFLAGMFALCMYGLMLTISPYVPTYRDRVFPPGVTIRPHEHFFIYSFNASEETTWLHYSQSMENFLKDYDDDKQIQNNLVCQSGQYFIQGQEDQEEKKACQFRRSQLQNCSGLEDRSFGFSKGKPCIFLKMNRIIGFKAGSGTPITVSCEVPKGNSSLLGEVKFYPANFFDLMYFPYYGKLTHVNYTSPLVAMHFIELAKNTDVTVQCKIHGHKIVNDHKVDRFLGRSVFTLHVR